MVPNKEQNEPFIPLHGTGTEEEATQAIGTIHLDEIPEKKYMHNPSGDSKSFSASKILPSLPNYMFSLGTVSDESLQISQFAAKPASEFSTSEILRQSTTMYYSVLCLFHVLTLKNSGIF